MRRCARWAGRRESWAALSCAAVLLAAFVALALLLAGTLRAEGVLAVANLLWVLFLVLGGVLVPRTQLPEAVSGAAGILPSAALGDGLRAAFVDGSFSGGALLVLLGWGAFATLLAARTFRWSD